MNVLKTEWEAIETRDSEGILSGWMVVAPPRKFRNLCIKRGDAVTCTRICRLEQSHYLPIRECRLAAKRIAKLHNQQLAGGSAS